MVINYNMLKNIYKGKTILVTGGTGTLGSLLVEQILRKDNPKKIIIYSRDEIKQEQMRIRLSSLKPSKQRYFIGDIRDFDRLNLAAKNNVDIIIHTSAIKIIDTAEYNPMESIKTNVLGAENVVRVSLENNISKVITISTDKAVNPINLYGASKLCSEKIFVAANNLVGQKKTKFTVLRYGNILNSRGSFFEKIVKNPEVLKKVNITHKDMTRFVTTKENIYEFINFVLKNMQGTEIFVLNSKSIKILEFVKFCLPKSKINFTGIRPGEKIHETLVAKDEIRNSYKYGNYIVILSNFHENKIKLNKKKFIKIKNTREISSEFALENTNNNFTKIKNYIYKT